MSDKYLTVYHGSPILIIQDEYFKSGTYFTTDIELAEEYGDYIFMAHVEEKFLDSTEPLLGNYVSNALIPIYQSRIFKLIK